MAEQLAPATEHAFLPRGGTGQVRVYPAIGRAMTPSGGLASPAPARPPTGGHERGPVTRPIADVDDLREHLQWAIELEHTTLPVYLCALYSLDPARNPDAAEVLTSIFVEEMLHMTLAANLLNAVGGRPEIDVPRMLPGYPRTLPHASQSLELSLLPFGVGALDQLRAIERPAPRGAPAESDGYETIGQFYEAIGAGVRRLSATLGERALFSGDPGRQVAGGGLYGGAGRLIAVGDLPSALAALDEIVEQGEGAAHTEVWDGDHDMFHPERDEVGHYFRLHQLLAGRRYQRGDTPRSGPTGERIAVDWGGVLPMERDPQPGRRDEGSELRSARHAFDRTYCALLGELQRAFDGRPEVLSRAVGTMYVLKAAAAALMRLPTGDGWTTAAPSFAYVEVSQREEPDGLHHRTGAPRPRASTRGGQP